jgi:hypothetical protein
LSLNSPGASDIIRKLKLSLVKFKAKSVIS